MRLKLFVILLTILCSFCSGTVFADGVCEEFRTFETPFGVYCIAAYYIPQVGFGRGLKTTIMWANISDESVKGTIMFDTSLMPAAGPRASDGHSQNLGAIFTDNRTYPLGALQFAQGIGLWVRPGESAELTLLYTPAGCNKYGELCQEVPDPEDKVSVGSASVTLIVNVEEGGADALRNLPRPSAQFTWDSGWQATEQALAPAPVWRTRVASTPDRKQEFMFAMGNPYKEETMIEGKIFNQNGKLLGTQSWTLPGQNNKSLYLTNGKSDPVPGFGSDPFPDGKNFTGWMELRVVSPATGAISVACLQSEGGLEGTMSNADCQPFYPKQ